MTRKSNSGTHAASVKGSSVSCIPSSVAVCVASMNPWERLAARTPSVFATDPQFARKAPANSGENRLDLGILSPKGEAGYVQRKAARSITKAAAKEIA